MTTPAPAPLAPHEERAVQRIIREAALLSIAARRRLWGLFARQERAYINRRLALQRTQGGAPGASRGRRPASPRQ